MQACRKDTKRQQRRAIQRPLVSEEPVKLLTTFQQGGRKYVRSVLHKPPTLKHSAELEKGCISWQSPGRPASCDERR